jgi:hypothetical protein
MILLIPGSRYFRLAKYPFHTLYFKKYAVPATRQIGITFII